MLGQTWKDEEANESTALTPSPVYGATSETDEGEESLLQQSSIDEGDSLSDDEWADEEGTNTDNESTVARPPCLSRFWNAVKNAIRVVADVENLWDTPELPISIAERHNQRRRNHLVVLFWFVMLAVAYASERSSFKLLVDSAGPFRLFAVEVVTASHAIILGMIMMIAYFSGISQEVRSLGLPIVDVALMALLDTSTLLLVYLTGLRVPPTLTVILVQFILPLTAFLTQFVHPDGRCICISASDEEESGVEEHNAAAPQQAGETSPNVDYPLSNEVGELMQQPRVEETALPGYGGLSRGHIWGSLILSLAVFLALTPACYAIADPDFFYYAEPIPIRTAINTLLYASSCLPAAASQLYKEHVFLQYKQPVNRDYLNVLLSIFQFAFASIVSPLVFGLQGLGARGDWTKLYPSTDFSENYLDGLKCFLGELSADDQENKYPEIATCNYTLGLALLQAVSIIVVGVAVDKIVNAGATKVMYRGISAGIILSVLCMHVYDMNTPDFNYGPAIDALNLLCLILLVVGAEVYHRVSLQESTFETEYPPVEAYYYTEQ